MEIDDLSESKLPDRNDLKPIMPQFGVHNNLCFHQYKIGKQGRWTGIGLPKIITLRCKSIYFFTNDCGYVSIFK